MKDWSFNLPYWARLKGYRLLGYRGTYDDLCLMKNGLTVRRFAYNEIPNLIEIEEAIKEKEAICG